MITATTIKAIHEENQKRISASFDGPAGHGQSNGIRGALIAIAIALSATIPLLGASQAEASPTRTTLQEHGRLIVGDQVDDDIAPQGEEQKLGGGPKRPIRPE